MAKQRASGNLVLALAALSTRYEDEGVLIFVHKGGQNSESCTVTFETTNEGYITLPGSYSSVTGLRFTLFVLVGLRCCDVILSVVILWVSCSIPLVQVLIMV